MVWFNGNHSAHFNPAFIYGVKYTQSYIEAAFRQNEFLPMLFTVRHHEIQAAFRRDDSGSLYDINTT